jgi:predicted N-acyltransferase
MDVRTGLTVDLASSIDAVDVDEWNQVVQQARAPAFYTLDYLRAYERNPMHAFTRARYLLVRRSSELVAVLPLYLQPQGDPLGVLRGGLVEVTDPALLGHVWYCYDTRIPLVPGPPELVEAVCDTVLEEIARLRSAENAPLAGLVNVAEHDALLVVARRKGWQVAPMETRFQLPLDQFSTFDDYLAWLPRRPRQNLRRHLRRARDAGVTATMVPADPEMLVEVCALCRQTAGKFGNADFYPMEQFVGFVMDLGSRALVARVESPDELLAAAVALLDEQRFHMWVAGIGRATVSSFSPHYVLWAREIQFAIDRGARLIEGGRRNAPFKERYGMSPLRLFACITIG